jgi:hypothetical protein
MLGEATLDALGTFPGEAIRLLTLIVAPQTGQTKPDGQRQRVTVSRH